MTVSSSHGRRVFVLQVSGLEYRYHSNTPPSSSNLDANITASIPYVDSEGIVAVGAFSASVDPSGGIAQYGALSITLQIDKKAGLGDPGVIFGRCGARSAGTRVQLTADSNRTDTTIDVDTDLSTLTFPKLLHIGSETVRASSATATTVTVTRGQGNTTPQNHSINLEGSFVPELTTEITTFRGRKAKLLCAHRYPNGSTSDYVEIMNGFIEQSPTIEDGETISLSLVPLTALIDTELSDKINQTQLLQDYHYYDGIYGSALEYALGIGYDENINHVRLHVDTSASITANTFQCTVDVDRGYQNLLDDYDASLPGGPNLDGYRFEHPRYPKLRRIQDSYVESDGVFPTATAFSLSLPGYVINADSSPSNAFTAGEITATETFTITASEEIKQHTLGTDEVKRWPNVINDTLETSGPSTTQGFGGGSAKWRLDEDNQIRATKLSTSPFLATLRLWTHRLPYERFKQAGSEAQSSRFPWAWSSDGTNYLLDDLSRLSYPIDIGEGEDAYIDSPRQGDVGYFKTVILWNRTSGAILQLRDIAKAYYQLYEKAILVENSLGLPVTATAGVSYDIIVSYYDRTSDSIKRQSFKASHQTTATFGGSDVGVLIHLSDDNDFTQQVSFGDWTDKERTLIFRGSSLIREDVGTILLRLLESGGGGQVNGTYDTLALGFNINSDDIDEESFLAIGSSCPFSLTNRYAGDGTNLRDTFESLLKLIGAVLIMKRDETTGRSKITLQAIGQERLVDVSATIAAGDWIADQPPHWDIYEDIVTQIKYEFDYDPAEDKFLSEVVFNNQEAINRYGGESSKITLSLPGVSSNDVGRFAGDRFARFLPTSNRIFNILSNPLRAWRGSIGSGPSIFLDVGSYVAVNSPHLRGYSDSYGVTNGVGMIRSINQELMGEGCDLEILSTGLSPVAWNATATVTTIISLIKVEVASNDYSRTNTNDVSFFAVGDVVDYLPNGNHDAAITGLEIQSISGNIITFTTNHGITATGGTLEPTIYANASTTHQSDAYLANASNLINSTIPAQDYS
jgi:hypothetical protein